MSPLWWLRRQAWNEIGYAFAGMFLGVLFFSVLITLFSAGAGTFITVVGLGLIVAMLVTARAFGEWNRRLANRLLDAGIAAPPPVRARPGSMGTARGHLLDAWSWRNVGYGLVKLPLGILSFTAASVGVGYGLGGLTYWFWRPYLPCQYDDKHACHRGAQIGPNFYLDTPGRVALTALVGLLVLVLLTPVLVHSTVSLDRGLAQALLGPPGTADEDPPSTRPARPAFAAGVGPAATTSPVGYGGDSHPT